MSRLGALVQYVHGLLTAADILFSQALYIYSFSGVLSQLQIVIVLIQQVNDLFVVYLQKSAPYCEYYPTLLLMVNALKQKLQGSRDEPPIGIVVLVFTADSHHSVGLAGASLSVCKYGTVVS